MISPLNCILERSGGFFLEWETIDDYGLCEGEEGYTPCKVIGLIKKKLNGVAPFITDPPPTNSTIFSFFLIIIYFLKQHMTPDK